ncbi:hypothetical protein OF83DRAFT_1097031, partial [Amylostereum chailletii]
LCSRLPTLPCLVSLGRSLMRKRRRRTALLDALEALVLRAIKRLLVHRLLSSSESIHLPPFRSQMQETVPPPRAPVLQRPKLCIKPFWNDNVCLPEACSDSPQSTPTLTSSPSSAFSTASTPAASPSTPRAPSLYSDDGWTQAWGWDRGAALSKTTCEVPDCPLFVPHHARTRTVPSFTDDSARREQMQAYARAAASASASAPRPKHPTRTAGLRPLSLLQERACGLGPGFRVRAGPAGTMSQIRYLFLRYVRLPVSVSVSASPAHITDSHTAHTHLHSMISLSSVP